MSVLISKKYSILFSFLCFSTIMFSQNRQILKALTLQTGGYMGVAAFGVDCLSKKNKISTGVYYAYSPKFITNVNLHSFTWRTTYSPVRLLLGNKFFLFPLSIGASVINTFGPQLWTRLPDYYPNGYYVLPTRLNITLYTGSRIQFVSNKKIEAFYELGTSYRLVEAWYENENITLWDISNLSLGIRYYLN